MGVTLERVQNKFACIIGELCSEPDILSQFAIWVDLRIAEYKAKGAISLECSGSEPDPSWLRGHKGKVRMPRRITPDRVLHPHVHSANHAHSVTGFTDEGTDEGEYSDADVTSDGGPADEDIIVMGDSTELQDSVTKTPVFPIHMYKVTSRKRPLSDSLTGNSGHTADFPSVKSPKQDIEPEERTVSLRGVTQSLTSIITADRTGEVSAEAHSKHSRTLDESASNKPIQIIVKTENPSMDGYMDTHLQLTDDDLSAYARDDNHQVYPEAAGPGLAHTGSFNMSVDASCSVSLPYATGESPSPVKTDQPFLDILKDTFKDTNVDASLDTSLSASDKTPADPRDVMDSCLYPDYLPRRSRRSWTQDAMDQAVAMVKCGALSQRNASRMFGVPKTSLARRLPSSAPQESLACSQKQ